MSQANKNIPSLHKLVETAAVEAVLMLLRNHGQLTEEPWLQDAALGVVDPNDDVACAEARQAILAGCRGLNDDVRQALDGEARRIVALSEGKGPKGVEIAARGIYKFDDADQSLQQTFDHQQDDFGRATVLWVRAPDLFDDAERFFYAEHHRNFGRLYEVFDVDCDGSLAFEWNDAKKTAFEEKIRDRLGLSGPCLIQHFPFEQDGSDDEKHTIHMFLIRHAGPTNSVQHTKADLTLQPIPYRPPVEATLLFQADQKQIEVFANEESARPLIASAFAEIGAGSGLSGRPVTLRQYNLARFYRSLSLPQDVAQRLDLIDVRVIEVEARPQNFKRRVQLKVDKDDDIEQAARDTLGDNHIFTRAALISRVVLNLRFTRDNKEVNLPITLSSPNRCNLGSRRDPEDRERGFAVLEAYGIVRAVAPLDSVQEGGLFHAMLQLYESDSTEVMRTQLVQWGADVELMRAGGFLVPKGRASSVTRLRDDGTDLVLSVRPAGTRLVANDPDSGVLLEIDPDELERFEIKRGWLMERVIKGLRGAMRMGQAPRQDSPVVKLGTLVVGDEEVPVHLARRLDRLEIVAEVDRSLRGDGQVGYGVVLTATEHAPEFLGANVVVPLSTVSAPSADGVTIDQPRLLQALRDGRQRAQAATVVDLLVSSDIAGKETATLIIPGKVPFPLIGNQVILVERLLKAHRDGNAVMQAKDLFAGFGTNSPAQMFKDDVWKDYVGHPPGKARGWMLLV